MYRWVQPVKSLECQSSSQRQYVGHKNENDRQLRNGMESRSKSISREFSGIQDCCFMYLWETRAIIRIYITLMSFWMALKGWLLIKWERAIFAQQCRRLVVCGAFVETVTKSTTELALVLHSWTRQLLPLLIMNMTEETKIAVSFHVASHKLIGGYATPL